MRYTADEERNMRCRLGKNYEKNEETKIIVYNPSENHMGERDWTTMDSIKNMLDIAAKEHGYEVQAVMNGARFKVNAGMSFDEAWQKFTKALNNVEPEKDLSYEQGEQKRRAAIKSLSALELISRLSGIYLNVDFDNPDIEYVLKNLNDYSYDDSVSLNENIIRGFSQYALGEVVDYYKQVIRFYKAKGLDASKLYTKEYVLNLAKRFGVPADIPVSGRYNVNLFMRDGAGRE